MLSNLINNLSGYRLPIIIYTFASSSILIFMGALLKLEGVGSYQSSFTAGILHAIVGITAVFFLKNRKA